MIGPKNLLCETDLMLKKRKKKTKMVPLYCMNDQIMSHLLSFCMQKWNCYNYAKMLVLCNKKKHSLSLPVCHMYASLKIY